VSVDGEVFLAEWAGTALSLFLDKFLGLSSCLSSCHYGWHLAALVLSEGLSNDIDGAAMGKWV
jgi:hypothetical protein